MKLIGIMLGVLLTSNAWAYTIGGQEFTADVVYPSKAFIQVESVGFTGYGIKGGRTLESWNLNELNLIAGYEKRENSGADLHTLSAELEYSVLVTGRVYCNFSGGLGYTMPSYRERPGTGDNGVSFLVSVGPEYQLTRNLSLFAKAEGFFFETDTQRTDYEIHNETLRFRGQRIGVQTITPVTTTGKDNFSKVSANIGLRYRF